MADNKSKKRRVKDSRPWWDTFPWWGLLVLALLGWMAWQISFNSNYELAWDRIWPGLRVTIRATVQSFGIALVIGLLVGMGQLSKNVFLLSLDISCYFSLIFFFNFNIKYIFVNL